MAVLVADFSVVIRNSAIEQGFPGGLLAFQNACPNKTLCSDGLLTRVGFMMLDDANFFLLRLIAQGLPSYETTARESSPLSSRIAVASRHATG
jgi:hypothetical protein